MRLVRLALLKSAMCAHEVRNPLATIGLNAELIEDESGENQEIRSLCRAIQREVDRLLSLTGTVLADARSQKLDPAIEAQIEALCGRLPYLD